MTSRILLDTGPLVALLNRHDRYHRWAVGQWEDIQSPLLTCEPVLTEACFLLRHVAGASRTVMEFVVRGALNVAYQVEPDAAALGRLLGRYADVPMSLADACLVRMAEQLSGARVFTIDRDFRVYRAHGRRVIPTIMPVDVRTGQ